MGFLSFFTPSKSINSLLAALDKSQAVIEFDANGTILHANKNFLNAVGYSIEEVRGQHHRMFVLPDYAASDEYRAFWDGLRRGEFQAAEYKRIGKGGREIWIQASYNPVLDAAGHVIKVVKYATDITDAKLKNADFQGQIEAIGKSQAVIHFDTDGTITWANENFLNAVGYSLEEISGQHHRIFVDPAYGAGSGYADFWEKLREGRYQAGEFKRFGKGGREVWIQASYNPILDPSGRVFKVVKYAVDITRQVQKRSETEQAGQRVSHNLDNIVDTVSGIDRQANAAADASAETSGIVQTVAAAAEELSSSVQQIAESMKLSKNAVTEVLSQTGSADKAAAQLSKNAESMNSIVVLIQEIANQINLLALNATIEAARAGEAGKGFAVVASEVKSLANQVAKATDQITTEIDGIQSVSKDVVGALVSIKEAIHAVQDGVGNTAAAIEEQNAVTREISSSMQSASTSVTNIDQNIREMSEAVKAANDYAIAGRDTYSRLRELD